MHVFVTGHKGYIGSHLIPLLKERGHQVTACDIDLFKGCAWEPLEAPDVEHEMDIRDLTPAYLEGVDCVMHLAGISNDPMGAMNPQLTYSINRDGSIELAKMAKLMEVPRFLFASSCSIYGAGEYLDLDESAPLNPLTAYAESKIQTEEALHMLADESFSPTCLRNATAYGHSPMLRVDLVVNNLLACAHCKGEIRIMSDGSPWRPLVHCKDIARAFVALMEAPRERVHDQVVNIGGNAENYQVKEVAELVQQFIPHASCLYTGEVGVDPRNYRVKFDLLKELLPHFSLEYTLRAGISELFMELRAHGFSLSDFEGDQFVRLRALKTSLSLLEKHPLPALV